MSICYGRKAKTEVCWSLPKAKGFKTLDHAFLQFHAYSFSIRKRHHASTGHKQIENKSHSSVYICLNSPYCNGDTWSILANFQKLQVLYWIKILQRLRVRLLNASFTRRRELVSEIESLLPSLSCSSILGCHQPTGPQCICAWEEKSLQLLIAAS